MYPNCTPNLLLALMLVVCFSSCERQDILEERPTSEARSEEEQDVFPPDYLIELGKKLENPYSVSVMKQAYKNVQSSYATSYSTDFSKKEFQIQTTDYYVRFLPKTDEEKEVLLTKDSLMLFDMPLDYELEEGVAGAYHDPSIPEGDITWQYTVVPVDYEFRDIEYEILSELFLQDDEYEEESQIETSMMHKQLRNQLTPNLWEALENEALRLTGNEDEIYYPEEELYGLFGGSKWYPSGTIRYEDTTTGRIVPLQGVQVVVKRWFKWKRDMTDSNGYFRVGKFRSRKVKCAIKWERHDWDIRSGSYGQAWYSFETLRRKRKWDITIRRQNTPRNWLYASVHRGAYEYFYNYKAYGIKKPYSKKCGWCRRLHIGAKHKPGRAHYFTFNKIWWSAPVVIYSSSKNGTVHDSRDIFATTVHELAHVSHWEIGYNTAQYVIDILADDPFLPESWAVGVEHTITNRVYPNTRIYQFPYDLDRQDWTLRRIQTESEGYTPIVIDMIDNVNQSTARINGRIDPNRPNDRVSGYTLGQLEDALPGSFGSWWRWRTRLRQMYNNPTDGAELDYLFREYR